MKLVVKEATKFDEGLYKGTIKKVELKKISKDGKNMEYVDITIDVDNKGKLTELRTGFPAVISENSGLGRLLIRMGKTITVGTSIELESLLGRQVNFLVGKKEGAKGSFAEVLKETLRPA
jgi:hypothetical protein